PPTTCISTGVVFAPVLAQSEGLSLSRGKYFSVISFVPVVLVMTVVSSVTVLCICADPGSASWVAFGRLPAAAVAETKQPMDIVLSAAVNFTERLSWRFRK